MHADKHRKSKSCAADFSGIFGHDNSELILLARYVAV